MSATDTYPLDTSALDAFTHTLRRLSPDDIRLHSTQLHLTGDDLDWWRTTIDVDRRLRDARLSRRAAVAARAAREAVLAAARAPEGIDADIVTVSRAAGDAARALVAGCHLTDASSFAVSCEPVVASDLHRATDHPTAA